MKFRPDKSRSIVLVKGRCVHSSPFSDEPTGNVIPSIHDMPVKFLGRIIDGSLSDRKALDELEEKLLSGLDIISKSKFKATQKLWILHHLLIPRMQWPLLIYEIPMTFARSLERKISVCMRKWLKLHHTTSDLCFYSSTSPFHLPMKSLTSILKSAKVSGHLFCRPTRKSGKSRFMKIEFLPKNFLFWVQRTNF